MYFTRYTATFALTGSPKIAAWEVALDDQPIYAAPWASALVVVTAGETPYATELVVKSRNVTYSVAKYTVASYEGTVLINVQQVSAGSLYYRVSVYWNGTLLDNGDGYTCLARSTGGPRLAAWYLGQRGVSDWARMTATELRCGGRIWAWGWDAGADLTYWTQLAGGPGWSAEVTGSAVQPGAVDDQTAYFRTLTADRFALSSRRPGALHYLYWISEAGLGAAGASFLAEEAFLSPRRVDMPGGGLQAASLGISYPISPADDLASPCAWVTTDGRRGLIYQKGSDVYYRFSDAWTETLMIADAQNPYLVHLEPTEDLMLFYHDGGSTLRAVRLYWNGSGYAQGDPTIISSAAAAERGDAVALPTGDVLCAFMDTSDTMKLYRGTPLGDTWEDVGLV